MMGSSPPMSVHGRMVSQQRAYMLNAPPRLRTGKARRDVGASYHLAHDNLFML